MTGLLDLGRPSARQPARPKVQIVQLVSPLTPSRHVSPEKRTHQMNITNLSAHRGSHLNQQNTDFPKSNPNSERDYGPSQTITKNYPFQCHCHCQC